MNEPLVRTMSSQLTARIRERILSGEYAPGAPLLQDSIAADFGVSKIPVREALVQLRSEGLVDIFAHRGFQVRAVSAEELHEVFRLRLDVEPAAIAEGARHASDDDRAAAAGALQALDAALGAMDLRRAGDLNTTFHLSLIVPRLHPVTNDVLFRLHTLSQRYVRLHLTPSGRMRRAMREHNALHRAWAEGRVKDAQRLTRVHIEEIREDLIKALAASAAR